MANLEYLTSLKYELNSFRPLHKATLNSILADLSLKYTYNSNAIEGNTLTISETKAVLEDGITIGGKSLKEHLEVINHAKAVNRLFEYVKNNTPLSIKLILDFHEIILKQIDDEWAGRFRNILVYISGAKHIPTAPNKVYDEMVEYASLMQKLQKEKHPVEYAALAHAHLVKIHPFVDGNGRTSRLIMNLELMKAGYPITIIEVTEKKEYCELLDFGHITNDYSGFISFIARDVEKSLNIYLNAAKANKLAEN